MNIKKFNNNQFGVNSFLIYAEDSNEAVIIDPAFNHRALSEFIQDKDLNPKAILLTHGHIDHIAEVLELKSEYKIDIYCHELENELLKDPKKSLADKFGYKELSFEADYLLKDNDIINFGPMTFHIIHTPGHTKGGICLLTENHMFTGDTLFAGSMGRTDLYGGNDEHMRASLYKLSKYDDDISIYPGHGPDSTMGKEKQSNPFLRNL